MNATALKTACHDFADVAGQYLPIRDAAHCDEIIEIVESLMEEAHDTRDDPLNTVISVLTDAISNHEDMDEQLIDFEVRALSGPADVAMLRLLMDQHGLGVADLPEIGSKSMVSRVLSGQRGMNKKHIEALSKRFTVSPASFFEVESTKK